MKKLYILPMIAAAMLAAGCSKDDPFSPDAAAEGQLLKSAVAVDVVADAIESTRAGSDANLDDFNIVFTRPGSTVPVARYRYGDMPEVITMPAGEYVCTATYGENRPAEWDSPYYLGTSAPFEVVAYEICSYIDPIECRLENVMVSVDFDPTLRNAMSADSYVEVKVGSSSALRFGTAEADAGRAGFFKYSEEVSLVAVFHGTVDGSETIETKSLANINKGNHYKIRFKLHNGGQGDGMGDVEANINVDASVTVVDVSCNVPVGEDPLLDDSERPSEGGGGSETPDPQPGDAPTIVGVPPVDIDAVNDGNTLTGCELNIHSSAEGGITAFVCDIVSEKLDADELESMGLGSHLDMVNTPASMAEVLSNLGFPTNVGGQKDVVFNITPFLGLLGALGECEHHFVLTVTDANGTTTKTLKIKY